MEGGNELFKAQAHVIKHVFNFISSMSLKCAVQLGIPDIIHSHGESIALSELISALPIDPTKGDCISRLMRVLVHSGFFATTTKFHGGKEEEAYVLTPFSTVLLKDQPNSLIPFVLGMFDHPLMSPYPFLADWMKGDEITPFESVNGMGFWEYMDQNPVFEGLSSLVDVGGGTGAIAKIISESYPTLKCSVLELPHVVANAPESSDNLKFIAGDMFESIPSADGVLLKLLKAGPDIIHSHGESVALSELISALPIDPTKGSCISRLMRVLVHTGFFATTTKFHEGREEEAYVLTPLSKVLLKDQPNSLTPFVLGMFDLPLMSPYPFLADWMKGDKITAFESVNGMGFWEFMDQNPENKNIFQEAMTSDSQMMNLVIKDCKPVFEGLSSLVDVGGGTGAIAKIISEAYPPLKCSVLELPHVVANAPKSSDNLKFIAGDMFESIPSADGVLLKLIMHAYNDEECIKVLKKCGEAIKSKGEGGKVIIIDIVIDEKNDERELTEAKLYFDVVMMALVTGRERTEKDWERLFIEAGFSRYKIRPIFGLRSLIEVYP